MSAHHNLDPINGIGEYEKRSHNLKSFLAPPMPPITCNRVLLILALLVFTTTNNFSQQPTESPSPGPSPAPSPIVDTIKTTTEEVQLTITALDGNNRLDPTLELADVLVLEDRVAQELTSARRVPAHVLILLDTGGEINSAKRVRLTREIARNLVNHLNPHDEVSIMQFNNKVEVLQNWTIDRDALLHTLDNKVMSGKRARFFDALIASAIQLDDRPQGNRHVVMITDGVQSPGERVDRAAALKRLQASNAVVHVISYTVFSRSSTTHDRKFTRKRDKSLTPKEVIDTSTPGSPQRRMYEPGGRIFDLDHERRKRIKQYEEAMRASEKQLSALAEDSGGRMWLPESSEEMIEDGEHAAQLIDSQFVVTYKPRRPLAIANEGEVRRIEVASRRVGLHLVSRRQFVVPGVPANEGRSRRVTP